MNSHVSSADAAATRHANDPWPAPQARGAVRAAIALPGSKSATNRALLLSALSDQPSTLHQPLISRDTSLMVTALKTLGTDIDTVPVGDDSDTSPNWQVQPRSWTRDADIDCGLAGTVMRFLPVATTLTAGDIRFDGDAVARTRPMTQLLSALRDLGAKLSDNDGRLPLVIHGTGALTGGTVDIDASASSQFISALLLPAARFEAGITVRHVGASLPSAPHIAMTVQLLRESGVAVNDDQPGRWSIAAGPIQAPDWRIEPDLSNAAPFLAAALLTGGEVTVPGWPTRTTQPGDALRQLLTAFGARVEQTPDGVTVRGGAPISGVDVDLHDVGELTPVLAVLCALAQGPSRLRGIAHLRGHETDRLAALATEITKLGGQVTQTDDGLAITPRPLHGGVFATYHDHRMAQAGALLGLVVPGLAVENIATTSKTLPDFPGLWSSMLNGTEPSEPTERTGSV
ncbi:MAG: 3-phosphoshikimate 1-carboxyvinyltransferase [Pseudonocardiaceae bacterium]